jgi:hypothetical protein
MLISRNGAKRVSTQTLLSYSPSGREVFITAHIQTSGSIKEKPSGTVTFRTSEALLGTCTLDEHGTAQLKAPLARDPLTLIVGDYSGDSTFMASTGTCRATPRTRASTSIDVVIEHAISAINHRATAVATVRPVPFAGQLPTGIVTFRVDGILLASPLDRAGRAKAQLPASSSSNRSFTVEAHYDGDGDFLPSDGRSIYTPRENRRSTVTVLTILTDGPKLTLTAAIGTDAQEFTVLSGTGRVGNRPVQRAVPTGTVLFTTKERNLGRQAIANGRATLTITLPSDAPIDVFARYSGDPEFAPSNARETIRPKEERSAIIDDPNKTDAQDPKEKQPGIIDDPSRRKLARQALEQAEELLKEGKRDLAKKWFKKAIERFPDSDIANRAREKLSELGEDR